ncbi:MAG: hypothetical protein ACK5KQ_01105 [Anaerorhabdus sp.]
MFWRKKSKPIDKSAITKVEPHIYEKEDLIDFTKEILDQEEYDTVAIIASAILSTDVLDAKVKVKSIRRVDQDMEAAAIIAASVLANNMPDSTFRLVSIYEEGSK